MKFQISRYNGFKVGIFRISPIAPLGTRELVFLQHACIWSACCVSLDEFPLSLGAAGGMHHFSVTLTGPPI